MKRTATLVVLVFAFLLISAMKTEDDAPLGVNVVVAPSLRDPYQLLDRATPHTYTCRADVYDANDRAYVFAAPEVFVAPGEKESKTVTWRSLEVTFTVGVSKSHDRAITQVTAKRGGRIVLNQRSEIYLAQAEPANHFLR